MTVLFTLLSGLAAGLIHVLSGPDHLAAIAPLSLRRQSRPWLPGLRWGAGHAAGVGVIGALALLLRGVLPVERISGGSDRLVGALLIGIGFWALRKGLKIRSDEHEHDGQRHAHLHTEGRGHTHAAFGIGLLHGFAGSSHFLGILPSLALPSTALACGYLGAFGVGTIVAMMIFSTATHSLAARFGGAIHWRRRMMFASAAAAMMVGAVWVSGFGF